MIGGCFGEKGFSLRGMYIRNSFTLSNWKDMRNIADIWKLYAIRYNKLEK